MWSNALSFIVDFYKGARSTGEERAAFASTVTRLRQTTQHQSFWTDNKSEQQERKTSLFGALQGYASRMPERSAVGHWFQMTVPNERDKRAPKVVRSYEADFRPALGMEDAHFEHFLTTSAKKKALEHYILSSRNKPATASKPLAVVPITTYDDDFSEGFSEPDDLLIRQAQDETRSVRASVAANEAAPIAVFWLLSDDESAQVKQALITNKSCPLAILEKLTRDFDAKVSRKAQLRLKAVLSKDVGIASGNLSEEEDMEEQQTVLVLPSKELAA